MSLQKKLDNLAKMEFKGMTVADLVNRLAGLPPMMEVYVRTEDQKTLFLNGTIIRSKPPNLYLLCDTYPQKINNENDTTHEEKVAKQRQRAMQLSRESQQAMEMPPMEDQ